MCKIKDELNQMTIMEWSAILVCLTAIVYPFLADSGTAFDAPVLIQFLNEDDIKSFLELMRILLRDLPIEMLDCYPKKLRKNLEHPENDVLLFRFNQNRYAGSNLQEIVNFCEQQYLSESHQVMVLMLSDAVVPQDKRELCAGYIQLTQIPKVSVETWDGFVRCVIQECIVKQSWLVERIREVSDKEEAGVSVFMAVTKVVRLTLINDGLDEEQIKDFTERMYQAVEEIRPYWSGKFDAEIYAEAFRREFWACMKGKLGFIPPVTGRYQVEGDALVNRENSVLYDEGAYYVTESLFEKISAPLTKTVSLNYLKILLVDSGLIDAEGKKRRHMTKRIHQDLAYGVSDRSRRIKIMRAKVDLNGQSLECKTTGERRRMKKGFPELSGSDERLWTTKGANNGSILVIGSSGSGKTNALRCIENILAQSGARVLVMNFGATHPYEKGEMIVRVPVYIEGFPFPIFSRLKGPDGNLESVDDVVEAILTTFAGVHPLGERQRGALRKAISSVLQEQGEFNSFKKIGKKLEEASQEAASTVKSNFFSIFSRLKQGKAPREFLTPGTVSSLDLDGFDSVSQYVIAELAIAAIWRQFRSSDPKEGSPLYIVVDEFQNLNLAPDSVLSQLLREGRKYGLAVIMATQSLERFDESRTAIIMQAARQLYFRPARSEVRKIARSFGGDCTKRVEKTLLGLKQGQCLAIGCAGLNDKRDDEPVILTFPLWNGGGDCDVKTQND